MHVTSYDSVLALHVLMVVASFMMVAVIHGLLFQMRWARDLSALGVAPRLLGPLERLLPLSALVILGSGAWLIHLSGGEVRWSDGWVITSLVALVAVEGLGGSLSRRSERMQSSIRAAAGGSLSPDLRAAVTDPVLWLVTHLGTATFLGVVFIMVAKPSGPWSMAIVGGAAALGLVSALPAVRSHSSAEDPERASLRP